jgi:putative ribosome biogenesis GTPase RsgA
MKLLTSLHLIFQEENNLRQEEEVEDTFDGGGQDSEEEEEEQQQHKEEGHYEDEVVVGDGSALGSVSSCRYRTSHLIRPPVAPHEDNMVVIVPSSDA